MSSEHPINQEIYAIDIDTIAAMPDRAALMGEVDNHHNAAKCPHCTDNGRFVMVEAAAITALRGEVERNAAYYEEVWIARNQILRSERDTLRADNERLREILSFDCTAYPAMEGAVIKWAAYIAGDNGQPSRIPDPVQLLEICEDIAQAALAQITQEAPE